MAKLTFTLALFAVLFSVFEQKKNPEVINCSTNDVPLKSKFYVPSEIEISTKPKTACRVLINASK